MARLWQTAILANWEPMFKYMPIESLIKANQEEYYDVISKCNLSGNSNEFIEFMLKNINETVDSMILEQETTQERIINLIKENPNITQVEMAKILKLSRECIAYNIKLLKNNGIIERVGSTKKGSWKIV